MELHILLVKFNGLDICNNVASYNWFSKIIASIYGPTSCCNFVAPWDWKVECPRPSIHQPVYKTGSPYLDIISCSSVFESTCLLCLHHLRVILQFLKRKSSWIKRTTPPKTHPVLASLISLIYLRLATMCHLLTKMLLVLFLVLSVAVVSPPSSRTSCWTSFTHHMWPNFMNLFDSLITRFVSVFIFVCHTWMFITLRVFLVSIYFLMCMLNII